MIWQDILLERECEIAELSRALATAFDVVSDEVTVVDSIEFAPPGKAVVAEQTSVAGEFRCLLSVYLSEALMDKDPIEVVGRLCNELNSRALISDDSVNPYTMILVSEDPSTRPVALDVDSLDQREEYRLSYDSKDRT